MVTWWIVLFCSVSDRVISITLWNVCIIMECSWGSETRFPLRLIMQHDAPQSKCSTILSFFSFNLTSHFSNKHTANVSKHPQILHRVINSHINNNVSTPNTLGHTHSQHYLVNPHCKEQCILTILHHSKVKQSNGRVFLMLPLHAHTMHWMLYAVPISLVVHIPQKAAVTITVMPNIS